MGEEGLEQTSQELDQALSTSIRGLQFGDINGQNLTFTIETIKFLREQIEQLTPGNLESIRDEIKAFLEYDGFAPEKGKTTKY